MSVSKLKTVGSWYAAYSQDSAASERTMRGRVITGMLTGCGFHQKQAATLHGGGVQPAQPSAHARPRRS